MTIYFSLPITGSFIHKIITYSLWQFIYEVHLIQDNARYKFVVKKFTCVPDFLYRNVEVLLPINHNFNKICHI